MNEHFSRFISSLFHPVLLPLYSIFVIIFGFQYRYANVPEKEWNLTIMTIIAMTTLFPVLIVFVFKKLNMVAEDDLTIQKKRIFPLLIFFFFYLMAFLIVKPRESNSHIFMQDILLTTILLGATLSIVISFFINNFYNLSIHTVAAANMFMFISLLARSSNKPMFLMIVLSLIILGLVGASRIFLMKHSQKEIYLGIGTGLVGQLFAFGLNLQIF